MTNQEQRPWRGDAKAVDGDTLSSDSTAASPPSQGPEAAGIVPESLMDILRRLADALGRQAAPRRDKLRWTWDDLEALTGCDRRWMQQEIAAGRMPRPDLRAGRRAGWKPSTITAWLDSMAASQGRRRS